MAPFYGWGSTAITTNAKENDKKKLNISYIARSVHLLRIKTKIRIIIMKGSFWIRKMKNLKVKNY